MKYQGSCHCGKIAYEVEGEIDALMECNCSICSKRGNLLWFVPRAAVRLKNPESGMSTCQFNKKMIKHHFCPECGCAPLGFGSDGKGNEMAAINARCINNIDLSQFKINFYDGRSA